MGLLLLVGLALGLDSLRASCALGAIGVSRRRQYQMALAFGLSDGISPLIGSYLGSALADSVAPWIERVGPLLLAGYGLHVLWASRYWAGQDLENRRLLLGLPVAFSLDNLIVGGGLSLAGHPPLLTAAVLGASSAALSLAGFRIGQMTMSRLTPRLRWLAGGALLLVALGLEIRPD